MFGIRCSAVIICICLFCCSCKKTIQDQKEKYVLSVLTTGKWFLDNYTENGADNTSDFNAYEFQFYENSTMIALSSAGTENGTWEDDRTKLTMTITFPATDPTLSRLSHPWLFTKSNIGLVFAETTTASGKKTIRLKKKT